MADLIDTLAADLAPVRPYAVARRLGVALLAGGLVAFAGLAVTLGLRADLGNALATPMFWVKIGYTGALGTVGAWAIARVARPVGEARDRVAWGLLPLVLIGAVALWQIMIVPPAARMPMLMGQTSAWCPWLIMATSAPLFATLVWALRGLAPTRLALAGTLAGLTAGAIGASLYALHCPETAAPFIAVWYTLGIAGAGAIGGLAGPRMLRW